jgi:hypothetical protein
MTMPIKFDTLEYTRKLIEAGIVPDQAEAQAQALSDVLADATVSPSEHVLLRADLTARIEMLREEMHAKLKALEELFNVKLEALEERFNAKLEALEERFNAKLEALEERFNAKLEALKTRMDAKFTTVYWLLGIMLAMQGLTSAAVVGLLMK